MVTVITGKSGKQILIRSKDDIDNSFSFLDVIERVDNLPEDYAISEEFKKNVYYLTTHTGVKIGFVCRFVVQEMKRVNFRLMEKMFTVDETQHEIRFTSDSFETRNEQIASLAHEMCQTSTIEGVKGWRNERYPVWVDKTPYVLVERAAAGILGIVTYGVHINGYLYDSVTGEIKFWVPRRSATKPTWPSLLDNTVAGGIGYPCGVYETVLKEASEEASLKKDMIEENVISTGVVTYLFYQGNTKLEKFNTENSFIVGEVEHTFDLFFPNGTIPTPNDNEVESFKLLTLQQVIDALQNNEFKPNCGLILVDFLIRHGYITAENEPNYIEIVCRMHRKLPFPLLS
ncbi:hypothetical protein KAFR_0E04450 [Kazachstania africana CBS 2517]|uniref:Nudix hydrolase domain-containing protein n=1 Tax=Kazachstania africana (strain ATCC 22294 / BCRC 22015 / CBS 2517 / CECT 1963 / NBRC 1671 / NRRL Y-8276) TaxID=1071382 RepID=H2AW45_KAZAF|nr:hypothetical protein KAFR_0E04450 [Kazachstania africana CBS 2517]CCF58595.1 hypothetical protein KAFR_0E04450 [Kazachstania africana CBS 2517]